MPPTPAVTGGFSSPSRRCHRHTHAFPTDTVFASICTRGLIFPVVPLWSDLFGPRHCRCRLRKPSSPPHHALGVVSVIAASCGAAEGQSETLPSHLSCASTRGPPTSRTSTRGHAQEGASLHGGAGGWLASRRRGPRAQGRVLQLPRHGTPASAPATTHLGTPTGESAQCLVPSRPRPRASVCR